MSNTDTSIVAPPPSATPQPQPADVPVVPDALRPFWDEGTKALKTEDLAKSFGELSTFKAQQDERAKLVPADGKYAVALPKEFEGKVKVRDDDPRLAAAVEFAKKRGLTQDEFSELLGFEAQRVVAEEQAFTAAETARVAAETAKLGEKSKERIDAVGNALRARLTAGGKVDEAKFNALAAVLTNADAVAAMEDILAGTTIPSERPAPPNQNDQPKPMASRWYGNG